jgi:hypothetical protein
LVTCINIRHFVLINAYVALSVKEPGSVLIGNRFDTFIVKREHSISLIWDVGEVGGYPMPGLEGRGRAIPSQAGRSDNLPGVCNEQGPTAKAKVCSELYGNIEKPAEMTGSVETYSSVKTTCQQVTDCNTDYIYMRPHTDRQYVPLDPQRYTNNQDAFVKLIGWAGNLTTSGRKFQGILKD